MSGFVGLTKEKKPISSTLPINLDCLSNLTLGIVTMASRAFYCTWNDLSLPLCKPFLTAMLESLK